MADLFGIDLRTGCFCNIGACQQYLGLTDEDILANIKVKLVSSVYSLAE